jgi:hypothetical protein
MDMVLSPPMLIVTVVSGMIMPPFLDLQKESEDHTGCTTILRRMRSTTPHYAESRYQIPDQKACTRELIASEFHGEIKETCILRIRKHSAVLLKINM